MYDECVSKNHEETDHSHGEIYRCRPPNGLAWVQGRHETVVVEAGDQHGETLVADLCICKVWLRCYLLLISHICAIHPAECFQC